MADFERIYSDTIKREGGYVLTNHKNDRGKQTYAGISRRWHPEWDGWEYIDRGDTPPTDLVRRLYKDKFWTPIKGELITNANVAESIYDFGVNAAVIYAIKLAQAIVGVEADGKVGEKTINALNAFDPNLFNALYTLAKINRYKTLASKDRSQLANLVGWINRSFEVCK